jgi:hypothetical protein
MRLETVSGLPAHPLFVHIPIVLIPLVAIGVVATVVSASVRDRIGWIVLGLAVVAGSSTQLAITSGKALQNSVAPSPALDHHIQLAESIRPLALVLFLVALGVMLIDRRALGKWPYHETAARPVNGFIVNGLGAVAIVVALVTCGRLYQIGDSGAKATWQSTHIAHDEARR